MSKSSAARAAEGTDANSRRVMPCFRRSRVCITNCVCIGGNRSTNPQNSGGVFAGVAFIFRAEFLLQALGFEMRDERIDKRAELPLHHEIELMESEIDAMVGDAILRKIVRSDFLRTITRFNLAAAFGGDGFVLLRLFHFVETRAKHAHGFGAVLNLRFFVLLRNDEAGRNMSYAHGGIGCVYGLAARTR